MLAALHCKHPGICPFWHGILSADGGLFAVANVGRQTQDKLYTDYCYDYYIKMQQNSKISINLQNDYNNCKVFTQQYLDDTENNRVNVRRLIFNIWRKFRSNSSINNVHHLLDLN